MGWSRATRGGADKRSGQGEPIKGVCLRLEVRGTALKAVNITIVAGRFEPFAWTFDARAV